MQNQYVPMTTEKQVAIIYAASQGYLDDIDLENLDLEDVDPEVRKLLGQVRSLKKDYEDKSR